VSSSIPAPFTGYHTAVNPAWLDYNGHMNDSAYAVVCTQANELLLDAFGVSASYREATGYAMYTAEAHLRFLGEVGADAHLRAQTLLLDADAKKLRVHTTVFDDHDAAVLTGEYMFLHVDQHSGRVAPFPADRSAVIDAALATHRLLERPSHAGLGIGAPRLARHRTP